MAKKGRASRTIVWVILGLLFLGLVGFGASDFGGSVRTVGAVNGEEIDVNDYARELQEELRAASAETGRAFTLAEGRAFGIDRAVLSRLVNQAVLDSEVDRVGLSVGDEAVRDQVTNLPAFRGIDGSFDREAYTFTLERSGLTVAEFEERVRRETARNILQGAVIGAAAAPETYIDTLYSFARERRDITWAQLTADQLTAPITEPSEADLAAFHEENAERFTLPETKAITYAWITPDMLLPTIESDEAALRDLYESRIDEYVQLERRLVERLVFASEELAAEAKSRIDNGETSFDDLVEERGIALEDIDLGEVAVGDLEDAGKGVFALTEPGVTNPLPSPLGPALFRVNAVLSASEVPFEDAREQLEAEFAADRARRMIGDMIGELDDLLAGGATLEELAAETEMELGQIDWRQDVSDGVAAYDVFRDAALVTEEGDFPELIELAEGGLVALRVDEVQPPRLQPLTEIRADVVTQWELAEAESRLETQAQEAAEAIRSGAEMAGLDLPLATDREILRDAFLEGSPPDFVEGVFQMREGDVRVFRADGGAVLVRLDVIRPPVPDDAEAQTLKAGFTLQTEQEIAADLLQLYSARLQSQADIQVNQQAINAVHTQFP